MTKLSLRVARVGDLVQLLSPSVGTFTSPRPEGSVLSGGQTAGVLHTLGRAYELVVPEDVSGVVRTPAPQLVHQPVGYGSVLYELGALAASATTGSAQQDSGATSAAPVFRSPSAGRFWHRTSPNDPPLIQVGGVIEVGKPIGVIEVMKTFAYVSYAAHSGLPARARVVRVLAADGAEVAEKTALFELEPA